MNFATIIISMDKLESLVKAKHLSTEEFSVKVVESDMDYSGDKVWNELKSESNKAYKKLKNREYEIRNR